MQRVAGWAWKGLVVLALAGYQYLVHVAVSSTQPGLTLRLILILLPLLALACWIVARSSNKLLWLGIVLAAGILAWLLERRESVGLIAFNGASHTAAYLFLLWYFGRTLVTGAEPLITRFARRVHGTVTADHAAYTRRLTAAWCVFFAAQLLVSVSLHLLAPLAAWSAFINLLNLPLVLLMFVGEKLYRVSRHPDFPRVTIEQAVRAFIGDSASAKRTAAR